ncbi:DUF58 domain-containing protein [Pyrococcus furiosus DSM 3638]|uniref:DUF58 domain-containing protein n=3 Tax=Pyrococcus furiosus TaxID=2261 RepID=A0A5C0XTP8_PYRFU|nr:MULTISPECIES: DUF58 domain-containing protein [Pyrococcus]AAL80528.1 hypothetical protein PF0404 [Pyrococcus furiosus DSM 3638]AFN03195.1 hypothetical protein PFC_01110 [Pyrococcus furiosus COM1]MDK2869264.1 hypothetical protein [Pyrococcus sp.]QEK78120.1 DUF58 domain-containing protein [Pyrococcus furiosus DSM 3638]
MKREDILVTLSLLGALHGFLTGSLFGPLFGAGIIAYIKLAHFSFSPKISFEIEGPGELEEGKQYDFLIKIRNNGSPTIIKPIVKVPFEVKVEGLKEVPIKRGGFIKLKVTPLLKGSYNIGVSLLVQDLYGLLNFETEEASMNIGVVPSVDSIKEGVKEARNVRLKESYKRALIGSETVDFYGLREYYPGDDIRRIDWKASSRIRKLIIREFLKERDSDVYIVLDETREMRKGKIDYGSSLALYLTGLLVKAGYRVGLIRYWEGGYKVIEPGKGVAHLEKIRSDLKVRRERGISSLKASLSSFSEKGRKFLRKVFPKKVGIAEALLSIKSPSYLLIITDLMSNTSLLYSLVVMLKKKHKIIIFSPNPVLFYPYEVDKEVLKMLYESYKERELMLRKFSTIVPVIDLEPYDYEEVLRGLE